MSAENNIRVHKYPLLPYSQLVWDMIQEDTDVYTFPMRVKIKNESGLFDRLKNAIITALRNHPVFQMQVDADGKQYYEPQEDILHGQYYDIDLEQRGESIVITARANRILGDGRSSEILLEDILRAWQGQPLQEDDYLGYLQKIEKKKTTERYLKNKQWLETEFADTTCPVHPTTDTPIESTSRWIAGVLIDDYTDMWEPIKQTCTQNVLSLTGLISLSAALAIMEYNGTRDAALTWAYEGRDAGEERIYGSLHRDIPFVIKNIVLNNKNTLLRQARKQIRQGIAHSSYPLTLTKPHTERWNYAVNVIEQPAIPDNATLPFEIEAIETDENISAYSLLDIEIYETDKLTILYRYSATHYLPASIQRFADLMRKQLEWLVQR